MLKRSIAIAGVLVPGFIVGCGDGPILPGRTPSGGLEAAASAAGAGPVGAPRCVPFKVSGTPGAVQIDGGPPPAPLDITVDAEGQATHLGRYSSSANFLVTFTSPTTAVFDGGGSFTAANGDQLAFTYTGDFFPGPVAGGLGDYELTGGTGRFAGATGTGVFSSEGGHTTFDGDLCVAR